MPSYSPPSSSLPQAVEFYSKLIQLSISCTCKWALILAICTIFSISILASVYNTLHIQFSGAKHEPFSTTDGNILTYVGYAARLNCAVYTHTYVRQMVQLDLVMWYRVFSRTSLLIFYVGAKRKMYRFSFFAKINHLSI
jgi:hypothetical protein